MLLDVKNAAAQWDAAFNSGDTAALASFYAEDGRFLPAGATPVVGATAIGGFLGEVIAKGFRDHKITVEHVEEKGPIAIATGKWQVAVPGEGGALVQHSGNWANVLERAGSGWQVLLHMWN